MRVRAEMQAAGSTNEARTSDRRQADRRLGTEDAGHRARLAWLGLILTPGMGAIRTVRAVRRLGGAGRVAAASLTELEGAGMPANAAQFCFDGRALRAAEEELSRVHECGGQILCLDDDAYPSSLANIYDPPPVLWLRGDVDLLCRPGIGVVGTRHPSPYGAGMAEVLSRDLAARGLIIQSGMARGVDTAAHKGALSAPAAARWPSGEPAST